MTYECPNGHAIRSEVAIPCKHCNAFVAYEPVAVGLELHRQLEALQATVDWSDEDLVRNVLKTVVAEARRSEQPGVITFTDHGLACAIGRVVLERLAQQ